jgi:hypothetical protein
VGTEKSDGSDLSLQRDRLLVHIAGRMGTFLDGTVAVMVAFLQKGADMKVASYCSEVASPLALDYSLAFGGPVAAYPCPLAFDFP